MLTNKNLVIDRMEVVWTSDDARQVFERIQAEIVSAFALPDHMMRREPAELMRQRARAIQVTAALREMQTRLYISHTKVIGYGHNEGSGNVEAAQTD